MQRKLFNISWMLRWPTRVQQKPFSQWNKWKCAMSHRTNSFQFVSHMYKVSSPTFVSRRFKNSKILYSYSVLLQCEVQKYCIFVKYKIYHWRISKHNVYLLSVSERHAVNTCMFILNFLWSVIFVQKLSNKDLTFKSSLMLFLLSQQTGTNPQVLLLYSSSTWRLNAEHLALMLTLAWTVIRTVICKQ